MRSPMLGGKSFLAVALAISLALRVGALVMAGWATDAGLVKRRRAFGLADRAAARVAQLVGSRSEPMAYRDPLIENETFAPPQALLGRYDLEVFEDAALQVIDLVQPLALQERRRFLATNSAGAEHRDPGRRTGAQQPLALGPEPRREVAEGSRPRVDRTC